jgi:hypothetical protein
LRRFPHCRTDDAWRVSAAIAGSESRLRPSGHKRDGRFSFNLCEKPSALAATLFLPNESTIYLYEVRLRRDKRGFDLISDVLPFGRLWYDGPKAVANAIGYAEHRSRSHDAVIRVYDEVGNVTETHAHAGEFKEW